MIYSSRRFVLSLALCYFVVVFFSLFSIAIIPLGEERANLSVFRTFVRFTLVWFCLFSLPLGVLEGLRLVTVSLPGLFRYFFWSSLFSTAGIVSTPEMIIKMHCQCQGCINIPWNIWVILFTSLSNFFTDAHIIMKCHWVLGCDRSCKKPPCQSVSLKRQSYYSNFFFQCLIVFVF